MVGVLFGVLCSTTHGRAYMYTGTYIGRFPPLLQVRAVVAIFTTFNNNFYMYATKCHFLGYLRGLWWRCVY